MAISTHEFNIGETKVIIETTLLGPHMEEVFILAVNLIQRELAGYADLITSNTKLFIILLVGAETRGYRTGLPKFTAGQAHGFSAPPGQPNITINIEQFMGAGVRHADWWHFQKILDHEMQHLKDLAESEHLQLRAEAQARARTILEMAHRQLNPKTPNFVNLRIGYYNLLSGIMLEGLAVFATYPRALNHAQFNKLYSAAENAATRLQRHEIKTYEGLKNTLADVEANIYKFSYAIGWHAVHAILYAFSPHVTLHNIPRTSPYAFIELYEHACGKLGVRPVISLMSGRGLFDYNRTIGQLHKIFTQK